jgi:hypothetical protein
MKGERAIVCIQRRCGTAVSAVQAQARRLCHRGFRNAILAFVSLLQVAGCGRTADQRAVPASQAVAAAEVVRCAERGPVKLTVKADRGEVTIPEQLTLTITVESELGVDVTMPDAGEVLGDFAVVKTADAEPTRDDLLQRRQRVLTLESAVPGACEIPSVIVGFADPRPKADGSRTTYEDKVTTEPIRVTVREDLADVKGPVSLPLPLRYKLLLWGLGVVAAMFAIAMAARWWRRRREQAQRELPWARRLIAHEWALAELDKLAAENLVGRGLVQEFYYRINGLLRRYIELRFGLAAGEQTSEEFIRALQHAASFDPRHKEMLRRFVEACDPVKYARHRPERSEIDWVHATAREFVVETAERAGNEGQSAGRRLMGAYSATEGGGSVPRDPHGEESR